MKGIFSIEWMAQSSQSTTTELVSGSRHTTEPTTCGTNSESLPGFYSRQKIELEQENMSSALGAYNSHNLSHQTSHNPQGKISERNPKAWSDVRICVISMFYLPFLRNWSRFQQWDRRGDFWLREWRGAFPLSNCYCKWCLRDTNISSIWKETSYSLYGGADQQSGAGLQEECIPRNTR